MHGINPEIVRELWPSQGEVPYEERTLPLHVFLTIGGRSPRRCYTLGVTRKMVVYERTHPENLMSSWYVRDNMTHTQLFAARACIGAIRRSMVGMKLRPSRANCSYLLNCPRLKEQIWASGGIVLR